jgi:hypothetical protein
MAGSSASFGQVEVMRAYGGGTAEEATRAPEATGFGGCGVRVCAARGCAVNSRVLTVL